MTPLSGRCGRIAILVSQQTRQDAARRRGRTPDRARGVPAV